MQHKCGEHPHKTPADLSGFYVITTISNPVRYKRRYELYWSFKEMCEAANVKLITVEQSFGNRRFMVTQKNNPFHVQLNTIEELWHKENMINIGAQRACRLGDRYGKCREIAWVDADCRSARMPRDWFEETWHQLQVFEFVQMWETLIDLDIDSNPIGLPQPGFMSNYIKYGTPDPKEFRAIKTKEKRFTEYYGQGTTFGRPGLAWAANIDAFHKVGGLIDYSILGAGDWYMAHALIGSLGAVLYSSPVGQEPSSALEKKMQQWQVLCERWIKRDVGYVPGLVYHDWHGPKSKRFYGSRGKILVENNFNPDTDLKYDGQGLLQLETWEPRQIKMRDQIRAYFRARNEDATN